MRNHTTHKIKNCLLLLTAILLSTTLRSTPNIVATEKENKPIISITGINEKTVGKYEKFELHIQLKNTDYQNPYDPGEIDLYTLFRSPSGKKIRINGFFDDYNNIGTWKIRFSPNETGQYTYRVFVENNGRAGKTKKESFTAVESKHHGWIRPATINPHYFMHDDGTTFYATGVYSPWRNTMERFDTFAKHNANFFALWDIVYGGFVNGTGLIEAELGRYNQKKLGRIDSLLTIFEAKNIKLMYAIWPHDLFSETVWAAQWKINPYNQLANVVDVYSDSLTWEYQKQKYRYMIARFAHSRSWGIWELINEMNGTDGWQKGKHQEAYDWVEKCHNYFRENDPYKHPVTASFSGGFKEYRKALYERNDVPNIHIYPAQGWKMKYPADTMRSSMYNYAWASRRFWDAFEKPAIFGEAGADLAYYNSKRKEYHTSYHNAIWATLSNGLAGIPVWWQYTHLNKQDWLHLKYLADFVSDIDFANLPYRPVESAAHGADVYVMDAGQEGFGWARSHTSSSSENLKIKINKSSNEIYTVVWFNTWTGEIITKDKTSVKDNQLILTVPDFTFAVPDIAFKYFIE